jgi:hypothetical protein
MFFPGKLCSFYAEYLEFLGINYVKRFATSFPSKETLFIHRSKLQLLRWSGRSRFDLRTHVLFFEILSLARLHLGLNFELFWAIIIWPTIHSLRFESSKYAFDFDKNHHKGVNNRTRLQQFKALHSN